MKRLRSRYRPTKWVAAILGGLLLVVLMAPLASAHTGDQSYLYLDVGEGLAVEVHMPFVDLNEHLGLDIEGDDDEILAAIEANADRIAAYAAAHTRFSTDAGAWRLEQPQVTRYREGGYVAVDFVATDIPEDVPQVFTVTFDPFFAEDPDRDALFIVTNDISRGILGDEEDTFVRFTRGSSTQQIDLGDTSRWSNFSASVELGIDHIRTGPDHILFIAVLMLPSVLLYRSREWFPVESFGSSLWRILKIVTMFTVAHSITFTLAGLGIIEIDDFTAVEAIIAISITAAAVHNLRPVFVEREWVLAFAFGLFHGLGFASLVSNLDVSRSTQLISLLGRNVGIEIGQAVVVLVTFPALFILRRTRYYQPFLIVASLGLIVISLAWFGERVFDTSDWASLYTEEALRLPRAWWLLALFTALCAGAYWFERSRNRLLQPPSEPEAVEAREPELELATVD